MSQFQGMRALFINATLKPSPESSNTDGLVPISRDIMREHGVHVDEVRAIDHDIATALIKAATLPGSVR